MDDPQVTTDQAPVSQPVPASCPVLASRGDQDAIPNTAACPGKPGRKVKKTSLIQKPVTSEMVQANQSSSLKSSGPKTARGTARSSRNAFKHGAFAKVSPAYMVELGEKPAEFKRLRKSLPRTFQPEDAFEATLVDDMAELRWRLARLKRAEAATLLKRRWEFETECASAPYLENKGTERRVSYFKRGLSASPDSRFQCECIVRALVAVRDALRAKSLDKNMEPSLRNVYGADPSWLGSCLLGTYKFLRDSQKEMAPAEFDRQRESLVNLIEGEIVSFQKLLDLIVERDAAVTGYMRDAALLPSQEGVAKIVR